MTQTEARRLAREVGGIATQESRHRGQFPQPGEPWIVVIGRAIVRELPEATR